MKNKVLEHVSTSISAIQERLVEPFPEAENVQEILFQHSVLCQTCLPYRNPGPDVRNWNRQNGYVFMEISSGRAIDPETKQWMDVGIPFGPKSRLVLYHLNSFAVKHQTRMVEVENSLTAFVKETLKLSPHGRNIRIVKDQLARLAASDFRFGICIENRAITVKSQIIESFELWSPRNPNQKVLWPSVIQFSESYFNSLMDHAVPLNDEAIRRLQHSPMALDVYTWLAQRLHRVKQRSFVPWVVLKDQFGQGHNRIDNFKAEFRKTLKKVHLSYPEAKFSLDDRGMSLEQSRPPVLKKLLHT